MNIVFATCADLPAGDDDSQRLTEALAARGVPARWQVWDDPGAVWTESLVVIRSTWDYTRDRDAFVAWAAGVPRLENPAEVVAWNSDKSYLRDLAAAGLPVVPTTYIAPGETAPLPVLGEFVVKPAVGAGSRGAARFAGDAVDAARAHVGTLHDAGRVVLIQPYVSDVDSAGETAMVYLDGEFSHAVRKGALLPPEVAHPLDREVRPGTFLLERVERRDPSVAELALGVDVMQVLRARLGADLLYARVDLLPTPAGPVVVELELIEPSLFLEDGPGAADRLARAIVARA
jgi:glutathione synthase/RimK-type ligase-like ATP-grasp enzyme